MTDEIDEAPTPPQDDEGAPAAPGWKRNALGWGAIAAVASAALAIVANLSEIAGLFAPDETRELVEETRVAMQDTDEKVEELLVLLRNQAAASGLDLNIDSETAIRNAVQAIIASSNTRKQAALSHLGNGDVDAAASLMTEIAASQARAVSETSHAAADSWREAGALYYTIDIPKSVESYREADRLRPAHVPTMRMLAYALLRSGATDESARILTEILAMEAEPEEKAAAHSGLGGIAKRRGDYAKAEQHYRSALDATKRGRRSGEHIYALIMLGELDVARGNFDAASDLLNTGLGLAKEAGLDRSQALALAALATVAAHLERYAEAERLLLDSLEIHEKENDLAGRANTLGNLGAVFLALQQLDDAENRILEAAELSEQLGWQSSLAYDLVNLAAIAATKGEFALANERLSRAHAISEDIGLGELTPIIVFNRGEVARDSGDLDTACELWREALPMLAELDSIHLPYAESEMAAADCERRQTAADRQ